MMALLSLLLAAGQAAPGPPPVAARPVPATIMPRPPVDWTPLPDLPLRRPMQVTAEMSAYVRGEVRAGRCAIRGLAVRVDLALLVTAAGQLRRIVPRAINCPTVEQYASGLVSRVARDNIPPPGADAWYRTKIVFSWID